MENTILIADDEEVIQSLLRRLLTSRSCRIISARTGVEAVDLAESQKPNLIVMDVNMPDQDGWSALKELRERPGTQTIPVIMLTGRGNLSDKMVGFNLGIDDYVTKPFFIEELVARIVGILRRAAGGPRGAS